MNAARLAYLSPACQRALVAALATEDGYVGPDSWLVGGMCRRGLAEPEEDFDPSGEPRLGPRFLLTAKGREKAIELVAALSGAP